MKKEFFPEIPAVNFEGTESKNPLAFRYYDAERVVMGKMTLEEAYENGKRIGEPKQTSGKQELYEAIVNMY